MPPRTDRHGSGYGRAAMLVAVFASFGLYHFTNRPVAEPLILNTAIDAAMPFLPVFSVPYVLYIPYLFFTAAYGVARGGEWRRVGASYLIAQLSANAMYLLAQSHVPRTGVLGDDPFSQLTAAIYANDRPYNTFPSLHVCLSLVSFHWFRRMFPSLAVPAAVLTTLIVMATVLIRQHVVADVVGGGLLAYAAVAIAVLLDRTPERKKAAKA